MGVPSPDVMFSDMQGNMQGSDALMYLKGGANGGFIQEQKFVLPFTQDDAEALPLMMVCLFTFLAHGNIS